MSEQTEGPRRLADSRPHMEWEHANRVEKREQKNERVNQRVISSRSAKRPRSANINWRSLRFAPSHPTHCSRGDELPVFRLSTRTLLFYCSGTRGFGVQMRRRRKRTANEPPGICVLIFFPPLPAPFLMWSAERSAPEWT